MRYTLYVVCSTRGCAEIIHVEKDKGQKLYCPKCEKKRKKNKESA